MGTGKYFVKIYLYSDYIQTLLLKWKQHLTVSTVTESQINFGISFQMQI